MAPDTFAWPLPRLASCACGKEHTPAPGMPPVWLGAGVLAQAGNLLNSAVGGGPLLVVADSNTAPIAARLSGYLQGVAHRVYAFAKPAEANEATVNELKGVMGTGLTALISVGSGSLTDVVRLVAYQTGMPFVSVPTAASMDGYLSWGAPVVVEGYKLTHPANGPAAVLADLDVLSAAPPQLTRSGFGDVVGKYTSLADWHIGHLFSGEYWCPSLVASVRNTLAQCGDIADKLAHTPETAAGAVIEALFVTGHTMICVGNSRPASGSEHHVSHYWEMRALAQGVPHRYHGEQVAVACVLSSAVYREMLSHPVLVSSESEWQKRRARLLDAQARQERVERGFGAAASRLLKETPHRDAEQFASMNSDELNAWWDRCRRELGNCVPEPQTLLGILRRAGVPATPQEIGLTPEWVHDGILYARELRPRLTIFDVAAAAGMLDTMAERLAADSFRW